MMVNLRVVTKVIVLVDEMVARKDGAMVVT